MRPLLFSSLLLTLIPPTFSFYLPGVAPTSYAPKQQVPLHVNRLTPLQSISDNEVHSALSFGYYHRAFHFCRPADGPKDVGPESLGAVIFGDRIKTSPYDLHMLQNETCKRLCEEQIFDQRAAKFVNQRIQENFGLNWLIDGLPAATPYRYGEGEKEFYSRGFALGGVEGGKSVLYNHYDIWIDYHTVSQDEYRVVGVLVRPFSRRGSKNIDESTASCADEAPIFLNEDGETAVTWTYSVYWRPSDIAWSVRWDTYLRVDDPKIHWISLINSAVIVIFLTGTVSAILMRALKKDFARYSRLDTFNLDDFSADPTTAEDGIQEDSGWKLVHGDVFRAPPNPLLLSVLLGNGAQLFFMTGITIVFALIGFLSPSNRGSLGTTMILLWTLFSFMGGYTSARVYKSFGGEAWKRNIAFTPTLVPGIVFGTFFFLNLFLWGKGSSGAVPFTTMLVIVGIWFLISLPLSIAGSWLGFKQPVRLYLFYSVLIVSMLIILLGIPTTRSHKPNSSPDPTLDHLPPPPSLHASRWLFSLWRYLRRALLHHE